MLAFPAMKHLFLLVVLFCPLAAQDATPNLSGVWRWNPQKGTPSSHPPEDMRAKIEQSGSEIAITIRARNNGQDETNAARFRIGSADNKNEIHGAPMTSKAEWDGAVLVVDSVAKFGSQELRLHDRWTLSADKQ